MNKNISKYSTFLYIKTNETRLFEMDYQIACGYVRGYLKEHGVNSSQLLLSQVGSLYDVVEEIIDTVRDYLVLYVDEQNYRLAKVLTEEVKQAENRVRVIWFGPVAECNTDWVLVKTNADACVTGDAPSVIHKLLVTEQHFWSQLSGVSFPGAEIAEAESCMSDFGELPILYQSQVVPVAKAGVTGLALQYKGRSTTATHLLQELEYIKSKTSEKQVTLTLHDENLFANAEQAEFLLQSLAGSQHPFLFQAGAMLNQLNEERFKLLHSANFKRLRVSVEQDEGVSESLTNMIHAIRSNPGMELEFELLTEQVAHVASEIVRHGLAKACDVRIINNRGAGINRITYSEETAQQLQEIWSQHETDTKPKYHELAFTNGFSAYLTGLYPQEALNSVKHMRVNVNKLDEQSYFQLRDYLSLNSALIHVSDECADAAAEMYKGADNLLKQQNATYDTVCEKGMEAGYSLSHLYRLQPHTKDRYTMHIDDDYRAIPMHVSIQSYGVLPEKSEEDVFSFVEIRTPEQMDAFLEDIRHFEATGQIRGTYQVQSALLDACRWSSAGVCRLNQLPRLSVDDEMNVLPCNGCSKPIGTLEDAYMDLVQNSFVIAEEEQVRRGCASCPVQHSCSKCAMLPDYMTAEQYCEIRKSMPNIQQYQVTMSILRSLHEHTQFLKSVPLTGMKVSLKSVSHHLTEPIKSGDNQVLVEYVFMITIGEEAVLFNAATRRLIKLNKAMAIIVEALILGCSLEQLQDYLSCMFQVETAQAAQVVSQALQLLQQAGCLREGIRS